MKKKLLLPIMAVMLLAACSTTSTAPDEMALLYSGGSFDSQKFQKCVDPAHRDRAGVSDTYYTYPVGQRSFTFTNNEANKDRDAPAISITTKDPLDMVVSGTATFNFVNTCEKVEEFHRLIGAKYIREAKNRGEGMDQAWATILDTYFRQDLEKAMDATAKELEWRQLYSAPAVKEQWEDSVAEIAPRIMEEHAKAAYFTDIRLSLDTPQPPQGVIDSLRGRQIAIEDNNAQKERNNKSLTELDGLVACKDRISVEFCLQKYAIDSGKVTQVIVAPEGSGVNVGAK